MANDKVQLYNPHLLTKEIVKVEGRWVTIPDHITTPEQRNNYIRSIRSAILFNIPPTTKSYVILVNDVEYDIPDSIPIKDAIEYILTAKRNNNHEP